MTESTITSPSDGQGQGPAAQKSPNRLGRLSLILAIVGAVLAVIPFAAWFAWLLTLPAFILAIIALRRKGQKTGTAISGLVISVVAWLIAVLVGIASFAIIAPASADPGAAEAGLTSASPSHSQASSPTPSTKPSVKNAPQSKSPTAKPTVSSAPVAEDFSKYVELSDRDFALLVKDPDANKDKTYVLYAEVTQFDAATGKCVFRAFATNTRQNQQNGAGENAFFVGGDGDTKCSLLSNVVTGDVVKMWVRVIGSFTYENQVGGGTTVPSFQVEKIEMQA